MTDRARPTRRSAVLGGVLRNWRSWPDSLAGLWRRSLRFRTLVLTIALTALAILVACVWMALAIQNDLFQSRREQVIGDARRATVSAQATLDSAVQSDSAQVRNVMDSVRGTLVQQSASQRVTAFRIDDTPSSTAPQDFTLGGGDWDQQISDALRARVQSNADVQWWQSVALPDEEGAVSPGIVVGQQLNVDGEAYELYIAYDLAAAEQTLLFVQSTLWIVGLALIAIIAAISWFVLRTVTVPIADAAETSAELAAGRLDVRLDVHGEDELATLGRSFNAMADSIQTQIKELAELSLVQQRFVSDVSHELRTPLTTIRLAASVLNDHRETFDPVSSRAAELLHAQVQRFEVLLGDLLEISRYDAGSVQLELEPTSLAALAEDVVASMHQLADQDAVAVGVRDYGLGMRAEDQERVFDRFWRADPSRKRTIGGTGLGLSIALGDARLHGGTLAVWSSPGRGTNFVLTLPRHAHSEHVASPIPLDPGDDALEVLGMTQPIDVSSAERAGEGSR
ncbi:MAG: mtrB [Microbacterium sp.]|nr:mtrB [Microbacterium sp.]